MRCPWCDGELVKRPGKYGQQTADNYRCMECSAPATVSKPVAPPPVEVPHDTRPGVTDGSIEVCLEHMPDDPVVLKEAIEELWLYAFGMFNGYLTHTTDPVLRRKIVTARHSLFLKLSRIAMKGMST